MLGHKRTPVLRDVALNLNVDHVMRRLEIGPRSKLRLALMAVLKEFLGTIEDLRILEPAIAYELHLIDDVLNGNYLCKEASQLVDL